KLCPYTTLFRSERFAERALRFPRIAFPPLDERAVLRAQRVRRPAPLHRRLRERHAVVELRDRRRGGSRVPRQGRAVPGELAVLERDRLLRLVEHRGELEVCGELAVDGTHRVRQFAPLLRIGYERTREPADDCSDGGHDRGNEIGHAPIVPRPLCIHRADALDTSDVCCARCSDRATARSRRPTSPSEVPSPRPTSSDARRTCDGSRSGSRMASTSSSPGRDASGRRRSSSKRSAGCAGTARTRPTSTASVPLTYAGWASAWRTRSCKTFRGSSGASSTPRPSPRGCNRR